MMRRRSRLEGLRSGQRRVLLHGFAFFGQLQPRFAAGFGFAIERLRNRGRAAHLAQLQNLDLKDAALVLDLQHVAGVDLARGFGLYSRWSESCPDRRP